ncbi:alkaline phosphatase family protein [Candidatus Bipolaricaulota bacterium]|nr:alkaline phosphatase family protein [Candidatus Bipolaricaulota bacterium]
MCELLVVTWDGAPPERVSSWAQKGVLPNLAELRESGAFGPLESTIPPITGPAWASFHTGANPGVHGVFGWAKRIEGSYETVLVDSRSLGATTLWEVVGRREPVGVLGFPLSWPPREVQGFWVPGFLAPPQASSFPEEALAFLRKAVPDFRFSPPEWTRAISPEEWAVELVGFARAMGEAALHLARRYRPRLLGIHFHVTDTVQHYLFGSKEVEEVFAAVDRELGRLVEALRPRWVFVLSDHGMGEAVYDFHVNTWLLREGYLRLKSRPGSLLRRTLFRAGITPRRLHTLGERLYPLARRLGLLRDFGDIWARGGVATFLRGIFLTPRDIDWRRTVAYSHAEVGHIYLNRRGREPLGLLGEKEARRVREEIVQGLRELRTPDGKPLLGKVFFGEEVYEGPRAHLGPDILFLSRGMRTFAKGLGFFLSREIFTPSVVKGGHRLQGMLLVHGEGVAHRGVQGARLWDVAPTVLGLLGAPLPTTMDGRPLEELFPEGKLRVSRIPSGEEPRKARREGELIERLRGYGYL